MKTRLLLSIIMYLLCSGSAGPQASGPPTWKQEFARAQQVWAQGEVDRAFKVLGKAYGLAPDDAARAQIAFRMADWEHQLGNFDAARRWYWKCLEYAPTGSDLIRRANLGLSRLPSPYDVAPRQPEPPQGETPPPRPAASLFSPIAAALLVSFLGILLLLQWASGWRRGALLAQILLSAVLASGVALMLPIAMLFFQHQLQVEPDGWVAGGLTLSSVACLTFAARAWQQGQLLRNTPLARLRSASHGFLKVRGATVPAFGVVYSQVGSIPGIYISELSERYVRRVERYYDSQSKRWKTRTVYRWETIYSATREVNFIVDDGTGKALVEVQGAEFYPDHIALFYNYQPVHSFPWFARVGDVRTRIHYIPPNATVTVWARYYERDLPGTARDEIRLQYDRFHKCMVVLEGSESKVYTARTGTGLALAIIGVVMLLGVLFILLNPGVVTDYLKQENYYP